MAENIIFVIYQTNEFIKTRNGLKPLWVGETSENNQIVKIRGTTRINVVKTLLRKHPGQFTLIFQNIK